LSKIAIQETAGGVVFTVKVIPASSRTTIAGLLGGLLKVKVAAPAEKGKANQCLIEFLAKKLGVRKKDISILTGLTKPVKQIKIANITASALSTKLHIDK
jgi:uncharacterized protein (TIGR00251 family)